MVGGRPRQRSIVRHHKGRQGCRQGTARQRTSKSRHARRQPAGPVAPCSHRTVLRRLELVIGSYAEEGEPRFIIRYLDRPYRAIAWRAAGTPCAHPPTRELQLRRSLQPESRSQASIGSPSALFMFTHFDSPLHQGRSPLHTRLQCLACCLKHIETLSYRATAQPCCHPSVIPVTCSHQRLPC